MSAMPYNQSMATKKGAAAPADKVALYERLVATLKGVERKGDAMPYTSKNGHMFSYLAKTGTLALRLPEDVRAAFIAKYKTKNTEAYGIVQKEYVDVPDALLGKTKELAPYFAKGHAYVGGLKPKPTTRKKA